MKVSAGILLYKKLEGKLYFLLVHPGGAFFKNKDNGFWSIPKGELDEITQSEYEEIRSALKTESDLSAATMERLKLTALRELTEETSISLKNPEKVEYLTRVKRKDGKVIFCFLSHEEINNNQKLESITISVEWPKGTGRTYSFKENDKIEWIDEETALQKIQFKQRDFIKTFLKNAQGK